MDCSGANASLTGDYYLVKEMTEPFNQIGATVNSFKNFSHDVKVNIGPHDSVMLLFKFKLKKEKLENRFFYEYKVYNQDHLTGLFWTDHVVQQANYKVFSDIVSFDPTFRTNRYVIARKC